MLATPALLLALATCAIAGQSGQGTTALKVNAKRGEVHTRSVEDYQSKFKWAQDEAIRVVLKHPSLFTEESRAQIKSKIASWKKRSAMQAGLKNWGTSYSVQVGIGTPKQDFDSMIDTGSGDFWVIEKCNNQSECGMSKPFDETQSSTFHGTTEPYSIEYMKGETSGYWAQDVVSIGEQSNLTWFGAADHVTEWHTAQSSLIGFSFKGGSTGHSPWWMQVVSGWEQPMFSLYLGRTADDDAAYRNPVSDNGQVVLGGADTSKYTGEINFVDVVSAYSTPVYWECPMDSIKVQGKVVDLGSLASSSSSGGWFRRQFGGDGGGTTVTLNPNQPVPTNQPVPVPQNLPAGSRSAVIDSGTTLIYGPPEDVDKLYNAIPGSFQYQGEYFFQMPEQGQSINVSFTFGGIDYPLYDGDLVWQCGTAAMFGMAPRGGRMTQFCQGTIQAQAAGSTDWLVGATFMKNVYTVFRNEPQSIGFAPLSDAANIYFGTPWLPATSTGGAGNPSSGTAPTSGASSGGGGGGGGGGSSNGSGNGLAPLSGAQKTVVSGGMLAAGVAASLWLL